ncbi:aminotransferase class IV [Paenirhodobacter populi]|uniref:Probable branched-chain-amino-acid aminotransferase n=2 Tax=Paenirhodobacter populi TaxID=2306993 RepID=A0A443IRM2_9RHOB|nr:aminotransferase class IV [Sinirhodobacter populi]RWR05481.1 branched-chain amino acid--2-keto-4-methylthiobutyrate aminotransferase [Sinirhodobacter populi]RWR09586.1 branched-chain amino acid--2-keto-4-methylthiobutyrate aminotransferase [Sinirhodobacter populi]RWR20424.1 branched-chain amino acid--2-keto-4-methylthiobutyrate aminotransferase [Sinirhodobacter populi]
MGDPQQDFSQGAAYVDGRYLPLNQAGIPLSDFGFTKSDVTYDVVHVHKGGFFRLGDHMARFAESMRGYRMQPTETLDQMREIAARCVVLSGMKDACVSFAATRGAPTKPGWRRPDQCRNTFMCWVWPWPEVITPELADKGASLMISSIVRFPEASINPTWKNFQWRDLSNSLWEALDNGYDQAILLDYDGYVTEGPGYNIFVVKGDRLLTPDRGALKGVTARSVIDLAPELGMTADYAPLTKKDLLEADEVFLSTTAFGIMPVSRVDDHVMANGITGPVSRKVMDTYWRKKDEGWLITPINYADTENPLKTAA